MLASKQEIDMKAVQMHWFDSLQMPTHNVLASTVQHRTTIVEYFCTCLVVKGCRKLKTSI